MGGTYKHVHKTQNVNAQKVNVPDTWTNARNNGCLQVVQYSNMTNYTVGSY